MVDFFRGVVGWTEGEVRFVIILLIILRDIAFHQIADNAHIVNSK